METSPVSLDLMKALSAEIGVNTRLVQGAGGNVSVKVGGDLWVKASGTWLKDAMHREIFVRLDLQEVLAKLAEGRVDFTVTAGAAATLQPSIETCLHAVLADVVVVHVHSINALSWCVRRDGRVHVASRLTGLPWSWIEYVRPGLPLARAIQSETSARPNTTVFLLANHGLVVTAATVDGARALLDDVERRLNVPATRMSLGAAPLVALRALLPDGGRLPANPAVHALAAREAGQEALTRGALYPDHAVFLGERLPNVSPTDVQTLRLALSASPHCAVITDMGVVLGPGCSGGAEAMLECLAALAPGLPSCEELRFLTEAEIGELRNWDAEKLRQTLQPPHGCGSAAST